ncbi:MAG: phosphoribosylglycinamide formyltransferase [Pseudomonadales bacterium]|nr:phosphoribosylglycinamide formyltransferase [Pseudomonadales bacterium]
MNIGVLASHGGTTLQAIFDAIRAGQLAVRVTIVISNNSDSGAMRRAGQAGVHTAHISGRTHPDDVLRDAAIRDLLTAHDVDLVVLAGYMKPLGPLTLSAFRNRIINTHPSLLPKFGGVGFYGLRVHQAVLAAHEVRTGATVHLVTADYDTGPVLRQAEISVLPGDTAESLQERVKSVEQELLIRVIGDWSERRTQPHEDQQQVV